jgi:hypothetical protein
MHDGFVRALSGLDSNGDPIPDNGRGVNEYLSPEDAGRCVTACVTADLPAGFKYSMIFAQSKPIAGCRPRFDLEPARRLVGFEPQDRFPTGISSIVSDCEYIVSPHLFGRLPEPE